MADHAAFLSAIRQAPDDDTHRLVYADWLEENGQEPRAEFIRVQIELARGTAGGARQRALWARERFLRRKHEADWLAPLRDVCPVERVKFERGLATVRLTSERFLKPHFQERVEEGFR